MKFTSTKALVAGEIVCMIFMFLFLVSAGIFIALHGSPSRDWAETGAAVLDAMVDRGYYSRYEIDKLNKKLAESGLDADTQQSIRTHWSEVICKQEFDRIRTKEPAVASLIAARITAPIRDFSQLDAIVANAREDVSLAQSKLPERSKITATANEVVVSIKSVSHNKDGVELEFARETSYPIGWVSQFAPGLIATE